MDLSFREKSIAGSLVITAVAFGWYFYQIFKTVMPGSSGDFSISPWQLLWVIGLVVVAEAVYHATLAVRSRPDNADERDRLIEAKATRIAYFVLVSGCFLAIGQVMIGTYLVAESDNAATRSPLFIVNLVLLSVVLAEFVSFALQLYYYRRGM